MKTKLALAIIWAVCLGAGLLSAAVDGYFSRDTWIPPAVAAVLTVIILVGNKISKR